MQHNFWDLVKSAKHINLLNSQLKELLPDNLQNINLVKIENKTAWFLVDNSAELQLAKTIDLNNYLQQLNLDITIVKFEIKH
jgi:hypothetical protein